MKINIFKLNVVRQKIPLSIKLYKSSLNVLDCLKVMKLAETSAGCQNCAVWEKICTYILFELGKSVGKHWILIHPKMAANNQSPFVRLLLRNKKNSFLTLTLSWGYQYGFSAEARSFLDNKTPIYVYVTNKLECGIWLHTKVKKEHSWVP